MWKTNHASYGQKRAQQQTKEQTKDTTGHEKEVDTLS